MKKNILTLFGMLGLGVSVAHAQTIVESWENTLDGWTLDSGWTSVGFSTTTGVTTGTYSWEITGSASYGTTLTGPASTALTTLLAHGASVSLDELAAAGSFGGWSQWEMGVTQNGNYMSFDGGDYAQSPNLFAEGTATWTIPASVVSAMLANPTAPSYLTLAIGGGGAGTLYLDNLRVTPVGLFESWENTLDGWSLDSGWTSVGFSTTTGVTSGTYSWEITGTASYGTTLTGPASTALAAELGNASSISLDELATAGSFGGWSQWEMGVTQNGNYMSFDGGDYSQSPNLSAEGTATWTIPASVSDTLLANPTAPAFLTLAIGGGGSGTLYLDNLRYTPIPPAPAQLSVRELWDDLVGDEIPATQSVYDDTSSLGFAPADPWVCNPAETPGNTQLMAFRQGFYNEPTAIQIGLPGSLDGSYGAMVQQNNGFSFFPAAGGPTFWTDGDFMTRQLNPSEFINFQAVGEYWFAMTIANSTGSLDATYVTFPASGAGGFGFSDGDTTNADFVAIGATGLNLALGPGATNASKALYISQGTLGQAGDPYSVSNSPAPTATYSETNFTGGPYHVNALGTATVGSVEGDGIVLLGHLKTLGGGSATLDAKYYTVIGGNPWNYDLDTTTNNIQWDCSYAFNFGGTMTEMLLFENGQFPFYVFGFRASTNFASVVGIDAGRLAVGPLTQTYVGYPINMTNLAVEAVANSFVSPPANYGTLTYQWYKNGVLQPSQTAQTLIIPSAALSDAGTYVSVATDPSGTWPSVSNSAVITVTNLLPPQVTKVQLYEDQSTFQVTFNEPNLSGVTNDSSYVIKREIDNAVIATVTNVQVTASATSTQVQLQTTTVPLGTKITMTISGVTNVVGGTVGTTNVTFWTDLTQTGVANWDAWVAPDVGVANNMIATTYFGTFLPSTPSPYILTNAALTTWEVPSGVTITPNQYPGNLFGDRTYGWFIPPVTTNYVFFISADDGGRLSLSTNASSTNLFVIACETEWGGADEWTNIQALYDTGPHRGDGTASGVTGISGYVWDNSVAASSPATACDQNRSDQMIVAFYDSSGLPGGPAGANDQANWASADSQLTGGIIPSTNSLWPNRDANGQALISLVAGEKYFIQFEHVQSGGGYDGSVTYKFAGAPDPFSGDGTLAATSSALTGGVIAGLVPFTPTISISAGPPVTITYTGVLLSSSSVGGPYTPVVPAQQSSGGPSTYTPPAPSPAKFYMTSE